MKPSSWNPRDLSQTKKTCGVAKQSSIGKVQVCVAVANDRDEDVVSQNAGRGRITATKLMLYWVHILLRVPCSVPTPPGITGRLQG